MNIYQLPEKLGPDEIMEDLWDGPKVRVERIISNGQLSPPGFWYDQPEDEWCVLMQGQAVLGWENGSSTVLEAGDHVLIPARVRHRVEYTSSDPPCIWLAVHVVPGS